jgi:hypothetical protein
MAWRLPKIQVSVVHLHGPEKPEVRLPPPPKSLHDMERDAWVLDAHTRVQAWRFAAFGLASGVLAGAALALAGATWMMARVQAQGSSASASPVALRPGHAEVVAPAVSAASQVVATPPAASVPQLPVPAGASQSANALVASAPGKSASATPVTAPNAPASMAVAPTIAASVAPVQPSVPLAHPAPATPAPTVPQVKPASAAVLVKPAPAVTKAKPAPTPVPNKVAPVRAETVKPAADNKEVPKKEVKPTDDVYSISPPIVYQAPQAAPQPAPSQATATQAAPATAPKPQVKSAFKVVGVPVSGVALIEVAPNQIVPFRQGDTLPDGRVLKSADPKSGISTN